MNLGLRFGLILVAVLAVLAGAGLAAIVNGPGSASPASPPAQLVAGAGAAGVGAAGAGPAGTSPGPAAGGTSQGDPGSSADPGAPEGPAGSAGSPGASSAPGESPAGSPGASSAPGESPAGSPGASPSPPASAAPTPSPSPSLVPDPLTGRPVSAAVAARHPIAVMVDDLGPARPQSGFASASIVWQAPAEGGIPRYMLVFADAIPGNVGPVRSSRYYYIAWAAEWNAAYVHAGGSPQALTTLRLKGQGQLVYNVDQFRYGLPYFWRVTNRSAPHNLYTDGRQLARMAVKVGATAPAPAGAWKFALDAPLAVRPTGGRISLAYPANRIDYAYDRATNTYLRSVSSGRPQLDAADGRRVAPSNVVVMLMHFGPLNDGHPKKERLEATVVGSGPAWIATNGKTIRGTWTKQSLTGPTLFLDSKGNPVTLTVGQTFIQVLPVGSKVTIVNGKGPKVAPPATPPWRLFVD